MTGAVGPAMPAARPVRARLATTALFLAAGSTIGMWAACIPAIKLGLAMSDAALGVVLLAFAGGAILAMPFSGWLSLRFGTARVAVVAGLLLALGLLTPGWAGGPVVLFGCALLLGACNGVLDVAMNAHATTVERAWRSPIMSSFHAAFSLGGLAGAAVGGALLASGMGLAGCLAVASVWVGGVVLAAAIGGLRRGLEAAEPAQAEAGAAAFAWPSRAQLGIGLLTFMTMLIEGAMADWSGVFLLTVAGASVAAAAGGYAAFSVAMVACRLLGDRIVLWLGEVRVLRAGALLAAAGLIVALVAATPGPASVGFGLVGLGVANMVPVLFSAAGRSRPAAPSVGVAMAATLGYAGFLIGPPVIGLLAELGGLRPALCLLPAAALAIAAVSAGVLARRRPRQTRASRLAT